MQSPQTHPLHTLCKQYGPGRLPNAHKDDIGAGYAAATAAVVATLLYGAVISVRGMVVMGIEEAVAIVFFSLALPFVVPAAFVVGVVGWRLLPSYTAPIGLLTGGLGAIATYVLATILFGTLLTVAAALSLTGTDPTSASHFSVGVGTVALLLTWWVTIPLGCLSGYVYVTVATESR